MAGIAQGLFLQIGDIHGFTQGADSVGIECFQRADPIKVDKNKEKEAECEQYLKAADALK